MTPENFVYWLNGFFELNNPKTLNEEQTKLIEQHLDLVFERQIGDHNKRMCFNMTNQSSWDMGGQTVASLPSANTIKFVDGYWVDYEGMSIPPYWANQVIGPSC